MPTMLVSIHARQFHSGRRPDRWHQGPVSSRFNPRPPISQRATRADQRGGSGGDVSIHARQFHSGRRAPHTRICSDMGGFNPRPPISQRATPGCHAARPHGPLFQSTPANFTAGDVVKLSLNNSTGVVSIHARQFHSGRRAMFSVLVLTGMFQSTPANFTAGDPVDAHGVRP